MLNKVRVNFADLFRVLLCALISCWAFRCGEGALPQGATGWGIAENLISTNGGLLDIIESGAPFADQAREIRRIIGFASCIVDVDGLL